MKFTIPEWLKPGFWGAVVGAIIITIVGFSAGWVVTNGAAEDMAERKAEKAVVSSLTPICMAQFKKAERKPVHLAALKEENSWLRGDYIEEHGWATMPGSSEPNDDVADACAEQLLKVASN